MEHKLAEQIAELVNARNQLAQQYDAQKILKAEGSYLFELSDAGDVIGCAEFRRL